MRGWGIMKMGLKLFEFITNSRSRNLKEQKRESAEIKGMNINRLKGRRN